MVLDSALFMNGALFALTYFSCIDACLSNSLVNGTRIIRNLCRLCSCGKVFDRALREIEICRIFYIFYISIFNKIGAFGKML